MTDISIRYPEADDIPALTRLVDDVGLFPGDMLAGMLAPFLRREAGTLWQVADVGGILAGLSYCAAEGLTDGTWNMLAICTAPRHQGHGVGRALVLAAEEALRQDGQRLLIVDTSGTEAFAGARTFYGRLGFVEEARIRDFWSAGDDKVTFRKVL